MVPLDTLPRTTVPPPRGPFGPRRDVSEVMVELHAQHGAELLRFCRSMLRDADDAADALQDTWIRAMKALRDDRAGVTAMRPWLYTIARNACMDRLRERKRRSLHDLDEDSAGDTPGADEVVALRHEADAALDLVRSLSDRQRSALLMRELAGMPVPDIAAALGLSVDRAAWTITDARRAVDEARAGIDMACEDARARLASGHRGRTLRAHLGGCTTCCAHDRRLRAKRVLAPAFLPLLWLRRLSVPLFGNPAAAVTVLATVAVTAAAPPPTTPAFRAAPPQHAAGVAQHDPAAARRGVSRTAHRAAHTALSHRPVPVPTHPATAPAASAAAAAPSERRSQRAPGRPSGADLVPVARVVAAAGPVVRHTVTTVTTAAAVAVPPVPPAVDDVARGAAAALDQLRR